MHGIQFIDLNFLLPSTQEKVLQIIEQLPEEEKTKLGELANYWSNLSKTGNLLQNTAPMLSQYNLLDELPSKTMRIFKSILPILFTPEVYLRLRLMI